MKTTSQITGINGALLVNKIINSGWASDYHKVDQDNDDAIDAMAFVRKRGNLTGEVIYIQIKTGKGYIANSAKRPNHIGVNVGSPYIRNHRPRWSSYRGAVILVYVDDSSDTAYWTDLKSDSSFTQDNKNIILVPRSQKFGEHSKGHFKKLGNHFYQSDDLLKIKTSNADFAYLRINEPVVKSARKYYSKWSQSDISNRTNPELGEILVNRVGWRHMTTTKKGYPRMLTALQLLSVAEKIILNAVKAYQITKPSQSVNSKNEVTLSDFISLRALVSFPNRQTAIVQVILVRKRTFNIHSRKTEQKIWFYSVYEVLRGLKF